MDDIEPSFAAVRVDEPAARLDALEAALGDEIRRSEALIRIGEAIGLSRDVETVVQTVVEGGLELTGAAFGAFSYSVPDDGENYMLYGLSGAPRSAMDRTPMSRDTRLFAPTFLGRGVLRSDDITSDPRYGRGLPRHGMADDVSVRSYLAAPVVSRSGEVMGGLFFGHADTGRFTVTHEKVVSGIASQGAAAIDAIRANDQAIAEVEARRLTEASLGESLSFALDAGRMGSWKLDVASQAYEASDLCKANYGRRPDEVFGFQDLLAAVHPEDSARMRAAIDAAIRDGSPYDIEYRVCMPTGEVRWVHVRGRADAIVEGGGAKRMAGVSLDVTERRRAEERQKLLLNELNHRVKNTLAAVQSIAFQTLRSARTPADFRDAFESRLMALSQTHNLLTQENWEGAGLRAVLQVELDAFGGDNRTRVTGPDIQLSPKAAVAIGMAFHELATNAAKYGALSAAGGGLSVSWRIEGPDLLLKWREEGGPEVEPPTRRGFGSRLLEQGLSAELGGMVQLNYAVQGLSCVMRLPVAGLERKD